MEQEREKQNSSTSTNSEEESTNYEAPEITKHEVLRDLTAQISGGDPPGS